MLGPSNTKINKTDLATTMESISNKEAGIKPAVSVLRAKKEEVQGALQSHRSTI